MDTAGIPEGESLNVAVKACLNGGFKVPPRGPGEPGPYNKPDTQVSIGDENIGAYEPVDADWHVDKHNLG